MMPLAVFDRVFMSVRHPARRLLALFCAIFLLQGGMAAEMNGVLREVYQNIGGANVSDLTSHPSFPDNPSFEEVLTNGFEAPTNVMDNYGQRLRAILIAPATGDYTFWIASDDGGALFLGENETPASRREIAAVPGWTSSREWGKYPEQQSAPIRLQAGNRYYIEALMKEAGGGDNLAVRWRLPNGTTEEPIPHSRLLVYGVTAPVITSEPGNVTVAEGGTAVFEVGVERRFGMTYRWQRDGVDIPGATNSIYVLEGVSLDDSGAEFRCFLSNPQGSAATRTATLTVTPDTTRPTLVSATNLGDSRRVTLLFSEPVEEASAADEANYTINNGITVESATFAGDARTIVLSTSALEEGITYTVTVSNVRDRATTPNTILPGSQRTFSLTFTPLDAAILLGRLEPPGPASRGTPLAITEIMYHPRNPEGMNLEFIEIYNSDAVPVDISRFRISGEVDFTFPEGTILAPDSYLVVAAAPADVTAHYEITNVAGPFEGSLSNDSGTVRLRNRSGAVLQEVQYSDSAPWPVAADGAGHSLVLARPSLGERDFRAWGPSDRVGGSPGRADTRAANPYRTIFYQRISRAHG